MATTVDSDELMFRVREYGKEDRRIDYLNSSVFVPNLTF